MLSRLKFVDQLHKSSTPATLAQSIDAVIERVDNFKLLGTWFHKVLKWNKHVEDITRKASKNLYCIRECRRASLPLEAGLKTYLTKIRPILECCSPVFDGLPQYLRDELERVQRRSPRIIGLPHNYLITLEERRDGAATRYFDTITRDPNLILHQHIINHNNHDYNPRHRNGGLNYIQFYPPSHETGTAWILNQLMNL